MTKEETRNERLEVERELKRLPYEEMKRVAPTAAMQWAKRSCKTEETR